MIRNKKRLDCRLEQALIFYEVESRELKMRMFSTRRRREDRFGLGRVVENLQM